MRIGAMNHPRHDPIAEIDWMAAMGLDFVDLTLEPPASAPWRVDPRAIRRALERTGLGVVGHTAYYLPIASAFESIRQAAVAELRTCIEIFGAIGTRWMNLHPGPLAPMHDRAFCVERNLRSLEELLPTARAYGVGLMLENLPGQFNTPEELAPLLDPHPEIGFHLDIGHANLSVAESTVDALIGAFGTRLRHVHLHDNQGGHADLHLPLGAGSIDWPGHLASLKRSGYNDTITLEVFTPDRHYLAYSRDRLLQTWKECGGPSP
jgi:sugar phosphate isomerase/epimerase